METIKKKIIYLYHLFCILCAVVLINSCKFHVKAGYIEDDKRLTEKEIEQFHLRINSKEYEAIYNNSSSLFKKSATKLEVIKAMEISYENCGQFDSTIDKRINVIMGAPVQIRAAYNSKYNKRDVTEEFLFVEEEGEIKLAQYQKFDGVIQLPDLGK
jgi:hypothetical protein